MKKLVVSLFAIFLAGIVVGQTGGITPEMLKNFRADFNNTGQTKALQNAVTHASIKTLALNYEQEGKVDKFFKYEVKRKGITDQESSGRCWLFTGLNVMRPKVIEKYNLSGFEFSQNYSFFFDQLEKSNLFLEGIIATSDKPLDDRRVEWLMKNAIGDGGVWNSFVNVVEKYGLVPAEAMPETKQSNSTGMISKLVKRKLRENAMTLRAMIKDGAKEKVVQAKKAEQLSEIYRMLAISFGVPPTEFTWIYKDNDGKVSEPKVYTPKEYYAEVVGVNLRDYVMLMNDPSREFNNVYEIDFDRNIYEGLNWLFLNLPNETIKSFALASIKDNEAMYFSCDVGKMLNSKSGYLDVNMYNYGDIFGVDFGMDKKARIQTFESGSSHGMTLVAVDTDENDKITKWLLENSWGPTSGFNGDLIMTDAWWDEYMFRVVINKKFIPEETLKLLEAKPTLLPPWDPMFAPEK